MINEPILSQKLATFQKEKSRLLAESNEKTHFLERSHPD
jgi:hypothetical protein